MELRSVKKIFAERKTASFSTLRVPSSLFALLPITLLPITLLLFALLFFTGCGPRSAPVRPMVAFQGETMGTTWSVKVVGVFDPQQEMETRSLAESVLDLVDRQMSTWREDSEISRLNRHGTDPFELSPAVREVFAAALQMNLQSGAAFDVTVGPLVNAWGFGPEGGHPPSEEELVELRARIGHDKIYLDGNAVIKERPDIWCDLSSIAKGFAVDKVAEALYNRGHEDFMVEVGGEVRTRGDNAEGLPWRIGIERPSHGRGMLQRIVPLVRASMATSGDYRNYVEHNGERISHIMDPRTGEPVPHRLASVTVIHERCMWADAWATALLVLGPDEGWDVALRENLAVLFLVRDGDAFVEKMTPAFEARLGGRSAEI